MRVKTFYKTSYGKWLQRYDTDFFIKEDRKQTWLMEAFNLDLRGFQNEIFLYSSDRPGRNGQEERMEIEFANHDIKNFPSDILNCIVNIEDCNIW